jgi:phosphohistidine swiveling domain-containing protein
LAQRRENWLQIDVNEFRAHLSTDKEHSHPPAQICPDCLSSLNKAVALFQGDFLEGFNLKDCPRFDEWQFYLRESLQSDRMSGTVRVMHGPADFSRTEPGDILVAPITTPAWTPLFALATAVVTGVGGPLSHSSIVAREYGIPAVLGTGVADTRTPAVAAAGDGDFPPLGHA